MLGREGRWALILSLAAVLLAACGGSSAAGWPGANVPTAKEEPMDSKPDLRDLGPAPELQGEVWLNSDHPLRLSELRGQVVLLEMWTFGCVNCQRVIPHLQRWHERYQDEGLVVIGNHYPEFRYEADLGNLKAALSKYEITYPVVQDNEGVTWRSYDNHYWPTLYLIDKRGRIRYRHIGEGAYQETEEAIQALLAEEG